MKVLLIILFAFLISIGLLQALGGLIASWALTGDPFAVIKFLLS